MNMRQKSFRGNLQRLSVALLTLVMTLTAQTAWAGNVMYVIATELSGNITITQTNERKTFFLFKQDAVTLPKREGATTVNESFTLLLR